MPKKSKPKSADAGDAAQDNGHSSPAMTRDELVLLMRGDEFAAKIVGGSIDDAKNYLHHLHPDQDSIGQTGIEANLVILRTALEAEKEGAARKSLITAIRAAIRTNENALDAGGDGDAPTDDGLPRVYGADAGDATPADAAAADGSPMLHLRFASPSDFAPHPELMAIPTMKDVIGYTSSKRQADRTEELLTEQAALYDDIARHGVIEPLKVVPADPKSVANSGVTWWIVDGRHRHDAAKWAGESEIPFVEVNPEEVESIIVGSIVGRRHWTKTQKAFLAVERNPFLLGGKAGRSGKSADSALFPTLDEVAARYGISRRLLCDAIEFYRPFAGKKALESVRLQIMAGIGFANVVSGKGGEAATKDNAGKPLPVDVATTRLLKFGKTLSKAGADEWSEDHLSVFGETVREFWKSVPASLKPLFAAVAAEEGGAE